MIQSQNSGSDAEYINKQHYFLPNKTLRNRLFAVFLHAVILNEPPVHLPQ